LGRDWALGTKYRYSKAEFEQHLLEVPVSAFRAAMTEDRAALHEVDLFATYANPCGFFAQAQALWFRQENDSLPEEAFWHLNVWMGYRFAQRRVELRVGGLNLTDRDYHLNPLTLPAALPRGRTVLVS